jgi:hypothetical protein
VAQRSQLSASAAISRHIAAHQKDLLLEATKEDLIIGCEVIQNPPQHISAFEVDVCLLGNGGRVFRGERECDFNDSGERF